MLFTKLNDCCGFSNRCISLQLYAVNSQSHPKQGEADCYKLVELRKYSTQKFKLTLQQLTKSCLSVTSYSKPTYILLFGSWNLKSRDQLWQPTDFCLRADNYSLQYCTCKPFDKVQRHPIVMSSSIQCIVVSNLSVVSGCSIQWLVFSDLHLFINSQRKEWSCTNSLGGMCVVDNTYAFGDDIKNGIS